MNNTLVYYPSKSDGNLYPVYFIMPNGQLTLVQCYHMEPNRLYLGYPSSSNILGQPPAINPITLEINNGVSNLVYYQPLLFGQNQLQYCISDIFQNFVLMIKTDFQTYVPLTFENNAFVRNQTPSTNHYIDSQPNTLLVNPYINIPQEIAKSIAYLQTGQLDNMDIKMNHNGFQVSADNLTNGERFVFSKTNISGIKTTSLIETVVAETKYTRQMQVKNLRLTGMTQSQIANHLGISQKTVSNDLRDLGMGSVNDDTV